MLAKSNIKQLLKITGITFICELLQIYVRIAYVAISNQVQIAWKNINSGH